MRRTILIAGGLLGVTFHSALAQFDTVTAAGGLDFALLLKLFGPHTNFSAKADVRTFGPDRKEKVSTPMDFAVLDRKVRIQIETAQIKNTAVPAAATTALKEFGLDQVVSLVRPDLKATYVILPGVKSFIKTPLTEAELTVYAGRTKLERASIGNETLDGHPCAKQKVTLSDGQGGKHEATLWCATDLGNFPVRIQTRDKDETMVLRFHQVQLKRADPRHFEVPAGYAEHSDVQSFMTGLMSRMLQQLRQ